LSIQCSRKNEQPQGQQLKVSNEQRRVSDGLEQERGLSGDVRREEVEEVEVKRFIAIARRSAGVSQGSLN
jgi:hypothetical protein